MTHPRLIFYDASCGLCTTGHRKFGPIATRRGFEFVPLQDPSARSLLGLKDDELPAEMKLQTHTGAIVGGIDAYIYIARYVWWAIPFHLLAQIPPLRALLQTIYRWIARNRHRISQSCRLPATKPR
jgi:predicted DCC family thiol-disulfide oxidoreductase YuxK